LGTNTSLSERTAGRVRKGPLGPPHLPGAECETAVHDGDLDGDADNRALAVTDAVVRPCKIGIVPSANAIAEEGARQTFVDVLPRK
jgi:hypothetical protein